MATHSSILACRIPCTEKPGGLQYIGLKELEAAERSTAQKETISLLSVIGKIKPTDSFNKYLLFASDTSLAY